jgi:hypothetical protein
LGAEIQIYYSVGGERGGILQPKVLSHHENVVAVAVVDI